MEVQFIYMTIAFFIMLIVLSIQISRIKELKTKYSDLYNKKMQEYFESSTKVYKRKYKYIIIENHDENTLNDTVKRYYDDGYEFDREKSTDRLLVYVKKVEFKPGFKD